MKTSRHTFPLELDNLPVSIAAILPIGTSISTELPQRLRYVAPRYCQTLAVRHNITYISIVREENGTQRELLSSSLARIEQVSNALRHTSVYMLFPPSSCHKTPVYPERCARKFIGYSAYVSYHLLYAAEYDDHAEF